MTATREELMSKPVDELIVDAPFDHQVVVIWYHDEPGWENLRLTTRTDIVGSPERDVDDPFLDDRAGLYEVLNARTVEIATALRERRELLAARVLLAAQVLIDRAAFAALRGHMAKNGILMDKVDELIQTLRAAGDHDAGK